MSLWEKRQRSARAWAAELPHGERSHARGVQGGVPVSGGLPGCRTPPCATARRCSGMMWGEERKLCLRRQ